MIEDRLNKQIKIHLASPSQRLNFHKVIGFKNHSHELFGDGYSSVHNAQPRCIMACESHIGKGFTIEMTASNSQNKKYVIKTVKCVH